MSKRAVTDGTKLLHAVFDGSLPALRKLLKSGVAVDATDRDGRSGLQNAVIEGKLALVSFFLAQGAAVDHQDRRGWTALHFAAQDHRLAIAKRLIAAGAGVDLADDHGNTPLSTATLASEGCADMIALLLDSGADPDLQNRHRVSPRKLAETIANYDLVQFFPRRGARRRR
jgi:uncharacterized protein